MGGVLRCRLPQWFPRLLGCDARAGAKLRVACFHGRRAGTDEVRCGHAACGGLSDGIVRGGYGGLGRPAVMSRPHSTVAPGKLRARRTPRGRRTGDARWADGAWRLPGGQTGVLEGRSRPGDALRKRVGGECCPSGVFVRHACVCSVCSDAAAGTLSCCNKQVVGMGEENGHVREVWKAGCRALSACRAARAAGPGNMRHVSRSWESASAGCIGRWPSWGGWACVRISSSDSGVRSATVLGPLAVLSPTAACQRPVPRPFPNCRLDALDSDLVEVRAASILHGLGFTKEMQRKRTREFSGGGWMGRVGAGAGSWLNGPARPSGDGRLGLGWKARVCCCGHRS